MGNSNLEGSIDCKQTILGFRWQTTVGACKYQADANGTRLFTALYRIATECTLNAAGNPSSLLYYSRALNPEP